MRLIFIARKILAICNGIFGRSKMKEKKQLVYFGLRTMHYQGINLLAALYDALLNTFCLVSKPHTKSSSALDYMNIV